MQDDAPIDQSTETNSSTSAQSAPTKRGRPRWTPTDEQRRQVKIMSAMGLTPEAIGSVLSVSAPTIRRWCRVELETGSVEANLKVAQSLFRQATHPTRPNVVAAIFWTKARMGWRDRDVGKEYESPAKKEERRSRAREVGASGKKLAPGRGPRLVYDNSKKVHNE